VLLQRETKRTLWERPTELLAERRPTNRVESACRGGDTERETTCRPADSRWLSRLGDSAQPGTAANKDPAQPRGRGEVKKMPAESQRSLSNSVWESEAMLRRKDSCSTGTTGSLPDRQILGSELGECWNRIRESSRTNSRCKQSSLRAIYVLPIKLGSRDLYTIILLFSA
jgi:hypothetical protein